MMPMSGKVFLNYHNINKNRELLYAQPLSLTAQPFALTAQPFALTAQPFPLTAQPPVFFDNT